MALGRGRRTYLPSPSASLAADLARQASEGEVVPRYWGRTRDRHVRRDDEVRENLSNHGRVVDRGDDLHPTAAAWTGEDVCLERAAHEVRPSPVATAAVGRGGESGAGSLDGSCERP